MLCLASYEKGADFLRECKRRGCYVILVTVEKLAEANWPHEAIDQFITVPDMQRERVIGLVSGLARVRLIDRVVGLDDYDVEMAAALREHLRVPGMGDTTARYFRDKLAMRVQAYDRGLPVPPFVHALNQQQIEDFASSIPGPWLLKPRSEASTVGIRRIENAGELWPALESLGDRQSYYLIEQYIPGEVYHVDAIVSERQVVFAEAHRYGTPPFNVVHDGGIFTTRTIRDETARQLRSLNAEVLGVLGFVRGVVHTEFIKAHADGQFYFLETSARVGGANISELVKASTGVNLWTEWAKIEIAGGDTPYDPPTPRQDYGGLIISLARQDAPDTGAYTDPEIVWRLSLHHHAGLLVVSRDPWRVNTLLDEYTTRFYEDFFASQPAPERPTS
jgi:biotin carboxylase